MTLKTTAENLLAKVQDSLHPNKHNSHATHSATTAGTHASHVDAASSTNHGPHSSNLANKLDPTVDSDRDGRNTIGHSGHATASHTTSPLIGSTTTSHRSGATNAGPHNSNIANKLDPRVDSDLDGRNQPFRSVNETSITHTHGTGAGGLATQPTTYNTSVAPHAGSTTTTVPHDSNLLNKIDPRVDSSDPARNHHFANNHAISSSGTHDLDYNNPRSSNAGPHSSDLLNKLDPRVDSDRDEPRSHPTALH